MSESLGRPSGSFNEGTRVPPVVGSYTTRDVGVAQPRLRSAYGSNQRLPQPAGFF